MAPFTVIYDSCVLYPAPLRDFLIQLALSGLYRACWTDHIHKEWIENVLKSRPDLNRTQLTRTKELMNTAIPDAMVSSYEHFIETIVLPDPNDRHVVADQRSLLIR